MIYSITVINYLGDSIELELTRPDKSGFIIESITGLGPGKANINSTEMSTADGSLFNSARVPSRNIVISVRYLWKQTIEDARQLSYKYFPLKRKVTLVIKTDNRTSMITGYVESNEPNIFSKEESADISIVCPDPFFYSAYGEQITTFGAVEPMFEFPFSNESLTQPLLEFSRLQPNIERNIVYEGDFEIGVTITVRAYGEASNITIYDITKRQTLRINTDVIESIMGSPIKDGDEIIICTVRGSKSAKFVRDGATTNILNAIDRTSDWFQLSKGSNVFACTAETGQNDLQFVIQNKIAYEGV